MLRRLHQNLAYSSKEDLVRNLKCGGATAEVIEAANSDAHSPGGPLVQDNEGLNMAHPEAVRISLMRQARRLNAARSRLLAGAAAGPGGGGVAAAGPSGVAPLPGVLPPPGVFAPHTPPGEPPGPALVPLFGQAYWGHPEAGSAVTDAQLQRVFDSGMDPAAMVKAGWWDRTVVYRWSAEPDPTLLSAVQNLPTPASTPPADAVVDHRALTQARELQGRLRDHKLQVRPEANVEKGCRSTILTPYGCNKCVYSHPPDRPCPSGLPKLQLNTFECGNCIFAHPPDRQCPTSQPRPKLASELPASQVDGKEWKPKQNS